MQWKTIILSKYDIDCGIRKEKNESNTKEEANLIL